MLNWNRSNARITALTAGMLIGTVLSAIVLPGCARSTSEPMKATQTSVPDQGPLAETQPIVAEDEASPEEIAAELGLPTEEGEEFGSSFGFSRNIPSNRIVTPERFNDFRVNVDIFRRSKKNPVLGNFKPEYVDLLSPPSPELSDEERTVSAMKKFKILASKEFALLSVDGVPTKAYVISAGLEDFADVPVKNADGTHQKDPSTGKTITRKSFKTTPSGNYRLDVLVKNKKIIKPDGKRTEVDVAYPWVRSQSYNNSQMYWELWIKGGYFIHTTPHYGELGQPASMGCIRQSFPDGMELFKLLVEENMPGMIRIHKMGSNAAVTRLGEAIKDRSWLITQLAANSKKINEATRYYGPEVYLKGHEWIDSETKKPSPTLWPRCGSLESSPIDCFTTFKVKKPLNSAN